jgi:hypothetical protein
LVSRVIAQSLVPGIDDDMPFSWYVIWLKMRYLKNKREIVEKFL